MDDRLEELLSLGGVKVHDKNRDHEDDNELHESSSSVNRKRSLSEPSPLSQNKNQDVDGLDGEEEFMSEFYQEVGEMKNIMSQIRRTNKKMQDKYMLALNSVGATDEGEKFEKEIEGLIDGNKRSFMDLKKRIESMKNSTESMRQSEEITETEEHIRHNIQKTMSLKFVEMMREFQELQTTYKNKYREKFERQYRVVNPDASEEEVQEVLDSGVAQKVFIETTLFQNLNNEAYKALNYVQSKHNDIIKIEQNIAELHQMFLDMAVLVEINSELLMQIESNVDSTILETREGIENLRVANKSHKRFIFF
ncbi:t-SNARE family protein [Tieghemostelium lacteum]|uniref:t-SNARE family protein n=1 Tax=Tieghemostelium lacteum TaxID=361077 RepID=A0A152A0F8_TIELA|nr:t-SNARE family protein [Tieghemostelium lacteum]|eukprot:KYQ99727.1 t-SNARE family protein [Tieghemostelium lacteum]